MYTLPKDCNKAEVLDGMKKLTDLLNFNLYTSAELDWAHINEISLAMSLILACGSSLPARWEDEYNQWMYSWFEEAEDDLQAQRELTHQL